MAPYGKTVTASAGLLSPFINLYALLVLPLGVGVVWLIYTRVFHPLAKFPGPFAASITRLWYVHKVREGSFDKVNRRLHAKYGPVVRIAPNEVSISDPEAMRIIYGIKSKFTKTDFYPVWKKSKDTKHADQFGDLDEAHHASRRRLLSNIYSMSSILESEPFIDSCTNAFLSQLSQFADRGEPVDLGRWVQWYAFDVIGELYFGAPFGFLETGSDYHGLIARLDKLLPINLTIALLPQMYRPLYQFYITHEPSIARTVREMGANGKITRQQVFDRKLLIENGRTPTRRDMLAKLFDIHAEKGEKEDFQIGDIMQEGHVGLGAGSDTTAIAMRAILFPLLQHPEVMQSLLKELESALANEILTLPVKYSDAIKLPFLTACVKEGMRLHPSVGLTLSRHVPPGGCELAGHFFQEGMRVGINPAVLQYDKTIFGEDAGTYNPQRWLQGDASNMDRYMLTFGGGTRTCIGKNISLSEIYKLLPQLLLKFEVKLVDPSQPLITRDWWFHQQEGLIVNVARRRPKSTL